MARSGAGGLRRHDPAFATQIETAGRTPAQIAEDIAERVRHAT